MNDHHDHNGSELLDQYLDGLVSGEQRHRFSQRLGEDAALQSAVDLQAQIDGVLRVRFAPPDADRALAAVYPAADDAKHDEAYPPAEAASAGSVMAKPLSRRQILVILSAAAAVVGAVLAWQFFNQPARPQRLVERTISGEYAHQVKRGFKAGWVCETNKQFASTYWARLGQGLLLRDLPPDIAALGLSYGHVLSPRTIMLLATIDGRKVIVYADRLKNAPPQPPAVAPDMYLHRREVNGLLLYELSPLDRPSVIEYFYEPDMPDDWKQLPMYFY